MLFENNVQKMVAMRYENIKYWKGKYIDFWLNMMYNYNTWKKICE